MAGDARLEWFRERAGPFFGEGGPDIVLEGEETICSFLDEGEKSWLLHLSVQTKAFYHPLTFPSLQAILA